MIIIIDRSPEYNSLYLCCNTSTEGIDNLYSRIAMLYKALTMDDIQSIDYRNSTSHILLEAKRSGASLLYSLINKAGYKGNVLYSIEGSEKLYVKNIMRTGDRALSSSESQLFYELLKQLDKKNSDIHDFVIITLSNFASYLKIET